MTALPGFHVSLGIPPSDALGTPVNDYIVADGAGVSIARGAGAEGDINVGQCEFALDNSTDIFSPGGDLEIREGIAVAVRAIDGNGDILFYGEVTSYSYSWPAAEGSNSPGNSVRVQCSEVSYKLAEAHPFLGYFEQGLGPITVNQNVRSDVAAETVMRNAGLALGDIVREGSTTDFRTLQTWTPANADSALGALQELIEAERRAWVFSDRLGRIHFAASRYPQSIPSTRRHTISGIYGPVNTTLDIDQLRGIQSVEVDMATHTLEPAWMTRELYRLGENRFQEPPNSPLLAPLESLSNVAVTEYPYLSASPPIENETKTPSATVRQTNQAIDDFSGGSANPGWSSVQLMQNFEAYGLVFAITLQIDTVGEPDDGIAIEVFKADSDSVNAVPDKSRFVRGMILPANEFPSVEAPAKNIPFTRFEFPVPFEARTDITSGDRYAFTLRRTGATDHDNYYQVGIDGTAGYGRMAYADYPGTGPWTTISANMGIALSVEPGVEGNEQADGLGTDFGGMAVRDYQMLGGNLIAYRVLNNSGVVSRYLTEFYIYGRALIDTGSRVYEAAAPREFKLSGKRRNVTVPWGESPALNYAHHLRAEYELDRPTLSVTIPWKDTTTAEFLAPIDLLHGINYSSGKPTGALQDQWVVMGIEHSGTPGSMTETTLKLRPLHSFRIPGGENTSSIAFDSFNRPDTADMSAEQTEDGRDWAGDTANYAIANEAVEAIVHTASPSPLLLPLGHTGVLVAASFFPNGAQEFQYFGLVYRSDAAASDYWTIEIEWDYTESRYNLHTRRAGGVSQNILRNLAALGLEPPFRIVVAVSGDDHLFWVNRRFIGSHSEPFIPGTYVGFYVEDTTGAGVRVDNFFAERIAEFT